MPQFAPGLEVRPGLLDPAAQAALASEIAAVIAQAPLFQPTMPRTGKPFSVRMTNCGALGWVADARGYRYQAVHPETDEPWPAMPGRLLEIWHALAGPDAPAPQACLVNHYAADARMGLHQDRDEEDLAAPVVSVSLGDTALFRIGGLTRGGPTRSFRLASGDVMALGGAARLLFHGIDRIAPGTSRIWPSGGRINLTMRRVTR